MGTDTGPDTEVEVDGFDCGGCGWGYCWDKDKGVTCPDPLPRKDGELPEGGVVKCWPWFGGCSNIGDVIIISNVTMAMSDAGNESDTWWVRKARVACLTMQCSQFVSSQACGRLVVMMNKDNDPN